MFLASWWPDVFPSFDDLIKWFRDAVVTVFEWLWNWVAPQIQPYWNSLSNSLAGIDSAVNSAEQKLQVLQPYIAYVNAWVPVDFAISLIVLYSIFWLTLVVYRSVKKWIPTLSG